MERWHLMKPNNLHAKSDFHLKRNMEWFTNIRIVTAFLIIPSMLFAGRYHQWPQGLEYNYLKQRAFETAIDNAQCPGLCGVWKNNTETLIIDNDSIHAVTLTKNESVEYECRVRGGMKRVSLVFLVAGQKIRLPFASVAVLGDTLRIERTESLGRQIQEFDKIQFPETFSGKSKDYLRAGKAGNVCSPQRRIIHSPQRLALRDSKCTEDTEK
jgi:hypothetical protein